MNDVRRKEIRAWKKKAKLVKSLDPYIDFGIVLVWTLALTLK